MKSNLLQFVIVLTLALVMQSASAQTVSWSNSQVIERVQMDTVNNTYFRPVGLVPWGGTGCPNATYVSIKKTDPLYEHLLTLALTSKLNQVQVRFRGVCSADGNYLYADYMYLK